MRKIYTQANMVWSSLKELADHVAPTFTAYVVLWLLMGVVAVQRFIAFMGEGVEPAPESTAPAPAPVLALPAPAFVPVDLPFEPICKCETPEVIFLANDAAIPDGYEVTAVTDDGRTVIEPIVYVQDADASLLDLMLYGGEGGEGFSDEAQAVLDAAFPPAAAIDAAVKDDLAQRRALLAKQMRDVFTYDGDDDDTPPPAKKAKATASRAPKAKGRGKRAPKPRQQHPEGKHARLHPGCELHLA